VSWAWGGLLAVGFLAGFRLRPSVVLARVGQEMAALRADIDGYRTAQEHLAESLERRMDDLEQTTARAANEVRMVSNEVMTRLHAAPGISTGSTT
jgi:hypothetical protein